MVIVCGMASFARAGGCYRATGSHEPIGLYLEEIQSTLRGLSSRSSADIRSIFDHSFYRTGGRISNGSRVNLAGGILPVPRVGDVELDVTLFVGQSSGSQILKLIVAPKKHSPSHSLAETLISGLVQERPVLLSETQSVLEQSLAFPLDGARGIGLDIIRELEYDKIKLSPEAFTFDVYYQRQELRRLPVPLASQVTINLMDVDPAEVGRVIRQTFLEFARPRY